MTLLHELEPASDFIGKTSELGSCSQQHELQRDAGNGGQVRCSAKFLQLVCERRAGEWTADKGDKHGNLAGNESDLGRDGAFHGFKILIGWFVQCDTSRPTGALRAKGFEVKEVHTEGEFIRWLDWCDVASFISSAACHSRLWQGCTEKQFLNACTAARNKGKGFWIWSDNDPLFVQANAVLPSWFGFKVEGNTPGGKVLNLADIDDSEHDDNPEAKRIKTGTFLPHTLTAGITKLFEGVTVSHPPKSQDDTYKDMEVLAMSSDGHPIILESDNTSFDDEQGRVILDCAFTKLYCSWDDAGTARYVVNGFVWLLALEQAALQAAHKGGELCVPSCRSKSDDKKLPAKGRRNSEYSGTSTASTCASTSPLLS